MLRKPILALAGMLVLSSAAYSTSSKEEDRSHKLFVDVCTACHTLERIQGQARSRTEWAGFIKGMVSEGAAVSDEEMDLLATYLAEHYGDK